MEYKCAQYKHERFMIVSLQNKGQVCNFSLGEKEIRKICTYFNQSCDIHCNHPLRIHIGLHCLEINPTKIFYRHDGTDDYSYDIVLDTTHEHIEMFNDMKRIFDLKS
jgi:hypothetical protein